MSHMSIELHDSDIEHVKCSSQEIKVFFSVILHESEGTPGIDSGVVYVQKAELLFQGDCKFTGTIKEYPILISSGSLIVNDLCLENLIPVPLDMTGKIKLTILPDYNSDEINITANRVLLTLLDKPRYLEKFPPF